MRSGADLAVRQDQDGVVGQHRLGGFLADAVDAPFPCPSAPSRGGPGDVDRLGAERAAGQVVDVADLFQIGVGQDRLGTSSRR